MEVKLRASDIYWSYCKFAEMEFDGVDITKKFREVYSGKDEKGDYIVAVFNLHSKIFYNDGEVVKQKLSFLVKSRRNSSRFIKRLLIPLTKWDMNEVYKQIKYNGDLKDFERQVDAHLVKDEFGFIIDVK